MQDARSRRTASSRDRARRAPFEARARRERLRVRGAPSTSDRMSLSFVGRLTLDAVCEGCPDEPGRASSKEGES